MKLPFLLACCAGWISCLALSAHAHLNSVSFSDIRIHDATVEVELRSTLICVLELFPLDLNGDQILTPQEIQPAEQVMFFYLNNKLKVLNGGSQMEMNVRDVHFEVREDDSYLVYDIVFPREFPNQPLVIMNNIQEETDPYHKNISVVTMDGQDYLFVFTQQNYLDTGKPSTLTPLRKRAPKPRGPMSATAEITPAT